MAPAVGLPSVALVGPRAAGKTTIGRLLAQGLGHRFLDGDDLLAAAVGMPAGVFLQRAGEREFRRRVLTDKKSIGLCHACPGGDIVSFFSDSFLVRS